MNLRDKSKSVLFPIIMFFLIAPLALGQKMLEPPKPTHSEQGAPCAKFKVVKEIESDFDEELFFARPLLMAPSKSGYLYVFDDKLVRMFVFNQKYEYVNQFLKAGQGPGEIFTIGNSCNTGIAAGPGNSVYVCNALGDRLARFSPQGKIIKEVRMNRINKTTLPFPPIVDEEGFVYAYSVNGGIVDKLDQDMNLVHTYLDKALTKRFIIYRPPIEKVIKMDKFKPPEDFYYSADMGTAAYDITGDGHLIIYLRRSSTIYVFKGKKLLRSFDVFFERTIKGFIKKAREFKKLQEDSFRRGQFRFPRGSMFGSLFADKDGPYFYLSYRESKTFAILYKFDLRGKIIKIYENFIDKGVPQAKVNGLFYGWASEDRHPIIFKEEKP